MDMEIKQEIADNKQSHEDEPYPVYQKEKEEDYIHADKLHIKRSVKPRWNGIKTRDSWL